MNQQFRQDAIIELVRQHGYMSIEQLTDHFAVTPQTIRRDLNTLANDGRVRRVHGGVGIESSTVNTAYSTRKTLHLEEKERIARCLADHIPNDASLFINIGTSNEVIAQALLDHQGLEIITNNLNVAAILQHKEDFTVIIAGGQVRSRDGGIIGEATIDFINQFKVDYGIIGISGIDEDGSLLEFDYQEVRVAQAIIANSRRVYLAADYSKFHRNPVVRQGNIAQLDALFTDRKPPEAIQRLLTQHDVALHLA
ncbi:DeoR/GlpR family transcriptional regulator [Halomonas janggokensis]|jgi:DeoR family glycerol-3-phosphate regulon repressor|uniref:DeoR/GlpR family transcriptional regulator n=1 Tax=Vreelandella janggokensis TaxID=370767 RepID=A0ABT4ISQ0_9GAMM|nr:MULTISPECIES: DeoR/GlpR family transcriptional regulator [Halomonas]MCW4148141.1 DeoR/GlpR family transcriptional regulator [Halomonas sp. 18H]MCZ0926658.1 DeoR/GlpR family transcriptional regulator [Halomonas janggokensis]MCZ0929196.1 DeoR/GlpR family transcriptional regulator [Halomonas janggokensis]QPL44570.1 DeoR/GlpR family transcriptional regulator [Halomonas sp. A40-4]